MSQEETFLLTCLLQYDIIIFQNQPWTRTHVGLQLLFLCQLFVFFKPQNIYKWQRHGNVSAKVRTGIMLIIICWYDAIRGLFVLYKTTRILPTQYSTGR